MMTKIKLAVLMCAGLAGGVAAASPFDGAAAPGADASAQKQEWQAKRAERKAEMLAKYDTNKDGKLDPQERAVMRDAKATERFQKMDTDNDGKISLDEFKAAQGRGRHARGGFHRHHRGGMGAPGGSTK
jgi:hypothetical protein